MSVSVIRGGLEESRHQVHAAVVRADGTLIASFGDPGRVTTLRSTAKPFQLEPLVAAGGCEGWDGEMVAVCCASHAGTDRHVAAVLRGFEAAGVDPDHLRNAAGSLDVRLRHNCSGNHLGFLAHSALRGWPLEGYREPGHPSQRAALEVVARHAGVDPSSIPTCPDGCGVVCFALPLRTAAAMYSRLADDLPRQAAAMRAAPEMVDGEGGLDTELMRQLPGAVAKGGAEALACVGLPQEGLGVAVRVEDGAYRALDPALLDTLRQALGWAEVPPGLRRFAQPDLLDSSNRAVGTLRSNVRLTTP